MAYEITSKALATALALSAAAPQDLEGLLFGRSRDQEGARKCLIESVRLVGVSWSVCSPNGTLRAEVRSAMDEHAAGEMRLLGWLSLRRGLCPGAPADRLLTHRERTMHRALGSQGSPGSAATDSMPPLGWVFIRASEVTSLGSLVIDSVCYRGPSLVPVELRVLSLSATDAGGSAAPWPIPGGLVTDTMHRLEGPTGAFLQALDTCADECFQQLCCEQLVEPGSQLMSQQREAEAVSAELQKAARSSGSESPAEPQGFAKRPVKRTRRSLQQ